ncbi:MAG: hypothetical protein DBY37_10565 [Desulfovibrionaceae bacterium]|nr:MAG: hypothetical protein DBY37_10565 [Desulfovibrionaceae bacterium]
MKNLLISIWIRPSEEESGETLMPQKNMTVRLRCSLDNGKKQWSPGECIELPEQQARELIAMGLAEEVKKTETAGKTTRTPAPEDKNASPAEADPSNGANETGGTENG